MPYVKRADGRIRDDQVEMVDRRYGAWLVLAEAGSRSEKRIVRALCDCGTTRDVMAASLLRGKSTNCGCMRQRTIAHGHAPKGRSTRTYRIWTGMLSRGNGTKSRKDYADRGITVCERWKKFENFLADMGECPPGLTLERMNNDGNYEPDNCCWATRAEQNRNKRNTRRREVA